MSRAVPVLKGQHPLTRTSATAQEVTFEALVGNWMNLSHGQTAWRTDHITVWLGRCVRLPIRSSHTYFAQQAAICSMVSRQ